MRTRIGLLALLALALAGCKFSHDPDAELYSCTTDADCGTGEVCMPRKDLGHGVCFPVGFCKAETCNGQDDDCDGQVDNVPDAGDACTTAKPGACSAGTLACGASGLECVSLAQPTAERCDGTSDLDCDGLVGCADVDCEGTHACGAGCTCRAGAKVETDCSNGVDDDGDGLTDCDDPDCLGASCENGLGNCGYAGPRADEVIDAGAADAGQLDAGSLDGGSLDGGALDAGGFDAGDLDAGTVDAGALDAGALDAGDVDAGALDAGDLDAGALDAGDLDAGALDAGPPDAGLVDGGPPPALDAGPYCAALELACDDGLDNDGDGRTDCLDRDCLGQRCNADGGLCLADGGCR